MNAQAPKRHSQLMRAFGVPVIRWMAKLLFLLFGRIRSRDKSRIPRKGPVLILANHLADVDPIAIQVSCSRPIHFMAKSELFSMGLLGKFLRFFSAFPVKRGEADKTAIRTASQILEAGDVVCVFPEGEISESGKLLPLLPGVALIARLVPETQIVCCGLQGTQNVMPYGTTKPKFWQKPIWVHWGEPRVFAKGSIAEEMMAWVEAEIRNLSGQEPKPTEQA